MFPDIQLAAPMTMGQPYTATSFKIIQIEDHVENKLLRAFVQLGDDASYKYWVPILSGDEYTVDWTNQQVSDAVAAFFASL